MPPTISVAAFVFGIVLLLAALIGKDLKIVTVELPALGPVRRLLLGSLGVALTLFGLMDGDLPDFSLATQPASTAGSALAASAGPVVAAATLPAAAGTSGPEVLPCLSDVAEEDRLVLPVETARQIRRAWSHGQPRAGLLAIQLEDSTGVRGGIKFNTVPAGSGFDIVAVYDAACQPVASYANVTNPSQPKDHPYVWDTVGYEIGGATFMVYLAYGEGEGTVEVKAQQAESSSAR